MHYTGLLYRAHNPRWAINLLSGDAAARYGGRFDRIGQPALYTSFAPETALREANQVGTLQPTVLVAYEADIGPLLDGRNAAALRAFNMALDTLADASWRDQMLARDVVPTHELAKAAILKDYRGLIVPSFARGAPPSALNAALWESDGCLTLVDDDARPRLRES